MWEQFQHWFRSWLGKILPQKWYSPKWYLPLYEYENDETPAMIEKIRSIDWGQYNCVEYYDPDEVVRGLSKLYCLSTKDGDAEYATYNCALLSLANTCGGTYYPAVESALPIIIEIAQNGLHEASRHCALEVLIFLRFTSFPDMGTYKKIDEQQLKNFVDESIALFLQQEPIEGESNRNKAVRLELIEEAQSI